MIYPSTGRVIVKPCECRNSAPAHLDVVSGAARPITSVDGAQIDSTIRHQATAMRVRRVYSAAATLAIPGERNAGYDPVEQSVGLDRVLAVEISSPARAHQLAQELTARDDVEWAMAEPLSHAPLRAAGLSHTFIKDSEQIDPDVLRRPFEQTQLFEALALEPGSDHIRVGVVDTGAALQHEEFAGRIHQGVDTVDLGRGDLGDGVELVGDSEDPDSVAYDDTGHGTHVAGLIAARGEHVPPGAAGAASLVIARALAAARAPDGQIMGIGGTIDIDAAVKAAVDLGSRVLNLSFGTSEEDLPDAAPPVHLESIGYALARGVIPVAAMGNSGRRERYFPAAIDGVIAVAAVDAHGHPSSFSTRGDHAAVAAPGENLMSAGLVGYRYSTGTSHAAPLVAGTIALMCARADRSGYSLTAEKVRSLLRAAAQPIDAPAEAVGAGLLNARGALERLDAEIQSHKESAYGR